MFSATREMGEQRVVLEDDADIAPVRRPGADFLAVEPDGAAVGRQQAGDDAQQGGLAAARGSQQRMNSPAATRRSTPPSTVTPPNDFSAPATSRKSRGRMEVMARPLDYIDMSRSQRFTQSARLSATNFQSMPKMVALVGAPGGTGVSLLVGSE